MPLREVHNLAADTRIPQGKPAAMEAQQQQQQQQQQQPAFESLVPVIDLAPFLALRPDEEPSQELLESCRQLAQCLERTGCLLVRDPRVSEADNAAFIDLMERYFGRPDEDKMADARPGQAYQVGATPSGTEVPRCVAEPEACRRALAELPPDSQPVLPTGPDVKWRFFWRVGPRPASTAFPELNAEPVVPSGLPGWAERMDRWGGGLLAAAQAAAGMAALGWGLRRDAFTRMMEGGPHLLAPTGSDLARHGRLGQVLAGFHADLNLLTIHGRCRFPGLSVWLADGTKLPAATPPGCLLLQAGKQLEWLTGGAVRAGMHEVVVSEGTLAALRAARGAGRSEWRVSSTLFCHVASDQLLRPLGPFGAAPGAGGYPATPAGRQVQQELEAIRLKRD